MLEYMPLGPPYDRPRRRRKRSGMIQEDELHEMLNRPTVTCPICKTDHWIGYSHYCQPIPKEEYL